MSFDEDCDCQNCEIQEPFRSISNLFRLIPPKMPALHYNILYVHHRVVFVPIELLRIIQTNRWCQKSWRIEGKMRPFLCFGHPQNSWLHNYLFRFFVFEFRNHEFWNWLERTDPWAPAGRNCRKHSKHSPWNHRKSGEMLAKSDGIPHSNVQCTCAVLWFATEINCVEEAQDKLQWQFAWRYPAWVQIALYLLDVANLEAALHSFAADQCSDDW